jgi:hypothetical protein
VVLAEINSFRGLVVADLLGCALDDDLAAMEKGDPSRVVEDDRASRNRSLGLPASATASSSFFLSPWDRRPATSSFFPARPQSVRTSRVSSVPMRSARENMFMVIFRREWTAERTFSVTLRRGKMLLIWKAREMPMRVTLWGGQLVMSWPSKTTRPPSGAWYPVRRLKKVLLPAPLGPMIADCSPSAMRKSTFRVT